MKNLKVVMLTALTAVGLASCGGGKEPAHTHSDANPADHICDTCGEKISDHVDTNKDHHCDVCGEETSQHIDMNHDGTCDYCGLTGMEVKHVDEDHDNKCDVCGIDIVAVSWKLDLSSVQLTFMKGEKFNSDGLKVVVEMTDGSTRVITGTDLTVKKPTTTAMNKVGEKEISVKFTVSGSEKELKYTINVVYWTDDEISILNKVSYLADVNTTYPYVEGATVETNSNGDWWIELPDATEDDLLNYNELLTAIKKTKNDADVGKVTYEVIGYEIPSGAAEYFDVDPDTAFACLLVPSFYYANYGYTLRFYDEDELIVVGLNEEGSMIVSNYFIDASIESYFSIIDNGYYLDGEGGFGLGYLDGLNEFFESEIGNDEWYDRPLANGVLPEMHISSTADGAAVFPLNYKTNYPFNENIQSYDVALEFFLQMASTADRTEFVDKLVARGFVAGEPENIGSTTPIYTYPYTLSNKFVGDWEVSVSEVLKDGSTEIGYYVDVLFRAPETKQTDTRFYTEVQLLPLLGMENATINESYFDMGLGQLLVEAQFTGGAEDKINSMISVLSPEYAVEEAAQEVSTNEWAATLSNGVYRLEILVSTENMTVQIKVSKYSPYGLDEMVIVTDIYQAANNTTDLPTENTDYSIDEDGAYVMKIKTDVAASDAVADFNANRAKFEQLFGLISGYLPTYMISNGDTGFYYADYPTNTKIEEKGTFISGNKLFTTELKLNVVDGKIVATITVAKSMPTGLNAQKVCENISEVFKNPPAVQEIETGVFSVTLSGAMTGLTSNDLSFDVLDYVLGELEDGVVPSYFIKASEREHDAEHGMSTDVFVSADGSLVLEVSAYFANGSTAGTYNVNVVYVCYPAED